jgi:hypothetical protein
LDEVTNRFRPNLRGEGSKILFWKTYTMFPIDSGKLLKETAEERTPDLASASSRSRLWLEAMPTWGNYFWVNLQPHDRTEGEEEIHPLNSTKPPRRESGLWSKSRTAI